MIESSIARRYAKALLEIAVESDELEPYLQHLEIFEQLCKDHPMLLDTLASRFMDMGGRLNIVDQLTSKLGTPQMVKNFLKLLIRKGRIDILPFIVKAYRRFVYRLQNKTEAVITSATPLDQTSYEEIKKILCDLTGKNVIAQSVVKPEILGGVAVQIEGQIYDGSVRTNLERMTEKMLQTSPSL